ncbi:hypothetical protein TEGAF0_12670 [Sediminibacterium sp. TEGAF015]|nr:hypothetical protein TEGAF0_12670 [Sediminibacterium sp. TEGAF015]
MNSIPKTNKALFGAILGTILVITLIVGIVDAYLKNDNLKIITRGCLLVVSIIYTYGNIIRYRRSKQSVQG